MQLRTVAPTGVRRRAKRAARIIGTATASARPLPDFLVVGTKRGGTTSLWNWLLQHPQVLAPFPRVQRLKSSHFFYQHYGNGLDWYRGFFPLATTRLILGRGRPVVSGEASPYYLYDPRVADRIRTHLPDVKIVMLLRDPVERAYSHFRERTHEGVESLGFAEALAAEPGRVAGEVERMLREPLYYSRPHDWYSYRGRGEYTEQVLRFQRAFPADQLLILRSETLYTEQQRSFDQVTDHLGIARFALPDPKRHNYHPHSTMPAEVRADLVAHYRPHNESLYQLLGQDLGWSR